MFPFGCIPGARAREAGAAPVEGNCLEPAGLPRSGHAPPSHGFGATFVLSRLLNHSSFFNQRSAFLAVCIPPTLSLFQPAGGSGGGDFGFALISPLVRRDESRLLLRYISDRDPERGRGQIGLMEPSRPVPCRYHAGQEGRTARPHRYLVARHFIRPRESKHASSHRLTDCQPTKDSSQA